MSLSHETSQRTVLYDHISPRRGNVIDSRTKSRSLNPACQTLTEPMQLNSAQLGHSGAFQLRKASTAILEAWKWEWFIGVVGLLGFESGVKIGIFVRLCLASWCWVSRGRITDLDLQSWVHAVFRVLYWFRILLHLLTYYVYPASSVCEFIGFEVIESFIIVFPAETKSTVVRGQSRIVTQHDIYQHLAKRYKFQRRSRQRTTLVKTKFRKPIIWERALRLTMDSLAFFSAQVCLQMFTMNPSPPPCSCRMNGFSTKFKAVSLELAPN